MTLHSFRKPIIIAATLLLSVAGQAAIYLTQIYGTDDDVFSIGRIEVVWSTAVAENDPVGADDLSELSFSFLDESDALVYTDVAISGGVIQTIGGATRVLSFDAVSGISIASFDNDLNQVQLGGASGTTYNLYGDTSGVINVAYYVDGVFQNEATFTVTAQNTTAIPEPSTYTIFAAVCALGIASLRRRNRLN